MAVTCIIIPPSPFLLDERVFMSLGALKVAASLEKAGWPVEVLDLSGYANPTGIVKQYLERAAVNCIGITATTPQLPSVASIVSMIRGLRPNLRIILGGPHGTLVAAARKKDVKKGRIARAHRAAQKLESLFDTIVAGDGEEAIFGALASDAPQWIDADDRHSPLWLNDAKLQDTAWPARHLVDVVSYRYQIDSVPALSIIAQLGCPFGCGFCGGRNSPSLRHIRSRSSQSVVDEMYHLWRTYGHRGIMFYDDELNVNKGLVELMDKIAATGIDWRLRGFIKAELFTDEQAEAMARAGFKTILVGFESGHPRILENINKRATREDNSTCMGIARRHGLAVKALMSIGHPGESEETIAETRRWLIEEKPSDFDCTIITPYPGSPYYDDAEFDGRHWIYTARNGDRQHQQEVDYGCEADYYKGNPDDGYVSHVWTDDVSALELVRLRSELETEVRARLGIPFNPSAAATQFDASMGQTKLPSRILRTSHGNEANMAARIS